MSFNVVKCVLAASFLTAAAARCDAACVAPDLFVKPSQVDLFKADPGKLFDRYKEGEGGLTAELRGLIVTDASAIDALVGAAARANAAQRTAIGAAMGQSSVVCRRVDPVATRLIQEAVVRLNMAELTQAYTSVTGDARTTATGSVAGGAGGGAGGGGGTGLQATSTSGVGGLSALTPPINNTSGAFSAGTGLAANLGSSDSITTFATVGVSSVSPASPQ